MDYSVDDLSDSFLQTMKLFHCDRAGVDAVILDSVRAHQGNVWTVKYDQWLSDGAGGAPRAMRTPREPFTEAKCKVAMETFLASIKQ